MANFQPCLKKKPRKKRKVAAKKKATGNQKAFYVESGMVDGFLKLASLSSSQQKQTLGVKP